LMAILTVKFLECDLNAHQKYRFDAAPAVAIGLLIIPLFDTLRVFVLRLGNGKSPFKADRNHIHHILLSMGLSHLRVTIIILLVNLFFVLFSIVFQRIGVFFLILLMLIFMAVLSFVLHAQAHRHKQ
ncbi:MAG TPA: undecaprenyl/decaprenyl-phosphate alpha-N-acetylglucosaminyl 1-phosphate transferase, partial [Bacteroidales bacterium]|nr:undecaprenyl/decaprenyl-phosphate alpha-N-acetylglucosaminyl 1-phosphate transferase [Bacteroidales bacterium]